MKKKNKIKISPHAMGRLAHRNITKEKVKIVYKYATWETSGGRGRTVYCLGPGGVRKARAAGENVDLEDEDLTIVVKRNKVITVMYADSKDALRKNTI